VSADVGEAQPPAPEVDTATPAGTLAADDEPEQDHTSSTKGKGKKGGKHRKR
jgi:hypothetical protein